MRLNDQEIKELNNLIRNSKFDLPPNKYKVSRHNNVYLWLQKNIAIKNSNKITPRVMELLDITMD